MILVTQLRYFVDSAASLLDPKTGGKCSNYICIVMLMMAVVGGMLQVTQDKVIYLPCKWVTKDSHNHSFWGWEPWSRAH